MTADATDLSRPAWSSVPLSPASPGEAWDSAGLRKARGAFFTPPELASYISRWALRRATDRVLEPSCGEAAFLLAAAGRLVELGAVPVPGQLVGAELHAASAARAELAVAGVGWPVSVTVGDFFAIPRAREFDAVIGNPPFVRFQGFGGSSRAAGRQAALAGGVGLSGLASSWAAFTVHSAEFVRPGERLGLVLPAELLTVNYASQVRRYLMERFGRVRLVVFSERVFPGVQEEVVLLLAEDALSPGGTDHCELLQVGSAADLARQLDEPRTRHTWRPADTSGKWTAALLTAPALSVYSPLVTGAHSTGLLSWGETTLGAVTGRNAYFALSPARAAALRLAPHETVPLSPPGSRHLRALSVSPVRWRELGEAGSATLLFRPGPDRATLSRGARAYLREGERDGVHLAYKCRVRSPWWQVPISDPADLLLTYMNADTPRLTTNTVGVRHLNSVHGVYLRPELRALGRELLPLASLNSLTLLGAELVGRAYGGGMLKLEPREADQLPVPTPELVAAASTDLRARRPAVRAALARGDLLGAVRHIDQVLLRQHMAVPEADHAELVAAHAVMTARRLARSATRPRPAL